MKVLILNLFMLSIYLIFPYHIAVNHIVVNFKELFKLKNYGEKSCNCGSLSKTLRVTIHSLLKNQFQIIFFRN